MNHPHSFSIRTFNTPTVLPRIALMFSRRGLTISQLDLNESDDAVHASLSVTARCTAHQASQIEAQLRRIVEVLDIETGAAATLPSAATA
jgi:acetolactate synthase small subunit